MIDFLTFDELDRYIGEADVIVTHGGVGSVVLALSHGKRPIVMPRRHDLNESVDDHQVSFVERLAEIGLATVVENEQQLSAAVASSIHEPRALYSGLSLSDELAGLLNSLPRHTQPSSQVESSEGLNAGEMRSSLHEDKVGNVARYDSFRAQTDQSELVSFEVELLDRQQAFTLHEKPDVAEPVEVAERVSDGHVRVTLFDLDKKARPL
jgi:hypothetical protein